MFLEIKKDGEVPQVASTECWRQILLDSADLLETRGWVQGRLGGGFGGRCVVGAMHKVAGELVGPNGRVDWFQPLVEAELNLTSQINCPSITRWNDMPGRTKGQILDALRTTAANGFRPLKWIDGVPHRGDSVVELRYDKASACLSA